MSGTKVYIDKNTGLLIRMLEGHQYSEGRDNYDSTVDFEYGTYVDDKLFVTPNLDGYVVLDLDF